MRHLRASKWGRAAVLALALLLLALTGIALAAGLLSIDRMTLSAGSARLEGGRYSLQTTIGQPVVGTTGSGSYDLRAGFVHRPSAARTIYLPLMVKEALHAPDLVVHSLIATQDGVQVVIANQGSAAVRDEFWVDFYVDPDPVPSAVNQNWPMVGEYGAVWGVTADALPALVPGGTITLTTGDAHYWPEYSSFPEALAPGTPVYAQVDSTDHATTYGAVLETHEMTGSPYNNIAGVTSTAALLEPTDKGAGDTRQSAGRDGLPRRH
jgi:hypothetical protein